MDLRVSKSWIYVQQHDLPAIPVPCLRSSSQWAKPSAVCDRSGLFSIASHLQVQHSRHSVTCKLTSDVMKMASGLLPFDGFPSKKTVTPEESKELLTTVVTPQGGLTNCLSGSLSSSLSGPIFACLSLGTVLHVIGITTTAWSSKWRYREGLWESCTCDKQKDVAGE